MRLDLKLASPTLSRARALKPHALETLVGPSTRATGAGAGSTVRLKTYCRVAALASIAKRLARAPHASLVGGGDTELMAAVRREAEGSEAQAPGAAIEVGPRRGGSRDATPKLDRSPPCTPGRNSLGKASQTVPCR